MKSRRHALFWSVSRTTLKTLKYERGQHKDMTLQLQFRLFRSKLSFRTSGDFELNEAFDVYDFIT